MRGCRSSAIPATCWSRAAWPRGWRSRSCRGRPRRVAGSLAALAAVDPARPVAVCRELTKVHEEVVRGDAASLSARYAEAEPRGEIVLVIGGAPPREGPDPAAVDAVRRLVEAGARARV